MSMMANTSSVAVECHYQQPMDIFSADSAINFATTVVQDEIAVADARTLSFS